MIGAGKKLVAGVAYGGFLIGVLLALDYPFYLRYVAKLEGQSAPRKSLKSTARRKGIPPELLCSLGWVADPREGRFSAFPPSKRPGTIRIGAFGDSYTYGVEVGPGLDYPFLLGELFKKSGFRNVEVINFGNGDHGFHQSFRLWDQLGRRYGLDVVLLGPKTFFKKRDITFNPEMRDSQPYYIHGRYILKDGIAVFEDVIGQADFGDRFRNYFRFLPHWRYLRYDANAPAILQCLLPAGREVRNWFYYRLAGSFEEELRQIDRALLLRLAKDTKQVVFLHTDPKIAAVGYGVAPNLHAEPCEFLEYKVAGFPYRRLSHYSAAGNALVARTFFDILTGRGATAWPLIEFRTRPNGAPDFRRDAACFSDFDRVSWSAAGAPLAEFDYIMPRYKDAPVDFRRAAIKSLFAFRPGEGSVFDLLFFPLDFRLEPGMRASLRIDSGGEPRVVDLAEAAPFDGRLSLGGASCGGFEAVRLPGRCWGLRLAPHWLAKAGIKSRKVRSGSVFLAGHEIAVLVRSVKGELFFEPKGKPFVYIRPGSNTRLDIDRLPSRGTASLDLAGPRDLHLPIAAWTKTKQISPHAGPLPAYVIRRSAADAGLAVLQPSSGLSSE
jgi:hypothetical protein